MMLCKSRMVVTNCPGAVLPQCLLAPKLDQIAVIWNQNIQDLVENMLYKQCLL